MTRAQHHNIQSVAGRHIPLLPYLSGVRLCAMRCNAQCGETQNTNFCSTCSKLKWGGAGPLVEHVHIAGEPVWFGVGQSSYICRRNFCFGVRSPRPYLEHSPSVTCCDGAPDSDHSFPPVDLWVDPIPSWVNQRERRRVIFLRTNSK